MNNKSSIFPKRGDRVKLIMLLGGGRRAESFLNAMEDEIRSEIDGYNRGARITDGKLQDTFIECHKKFAKMADFLDELPEAVKQDLQETANQNPPYKPLSYLIESLIEQLGNLAQAAETRARRIKPVTGPKSDFLRRDFLLDMITIYYDIYNQLPRIHQKQII